MKNHKRNKFKKLIDKLQEADPKKFTNKYIRVFLKISNSTLSRDRNAERVTDKIAERLDKLFEHTSDLITWDENNEDYIILHEKIPLPQINSVEDVLNIIENELANNKPEKLQILDTWMPYLSAGGANYLARWSSYVKKDIQLLILDPKSSLIRKRVKGLKNYSSEDAMNGIIRNIEYFKSLDLETDCNITVKLYDEFSGVNCFITDHKIYYGPYFCQDFSTNSYFHEIENNSNPLAKDLNTHFETIWTERSLLVDLEVQKQTKEEFKTAEQQKHSFNNQINRLKEEYYLYNLDYLDSEKPFQVSILKITDRLKGHCELIYADRKDTNKKHHCTGTIEISGDNNLLFKFQKGTFFLELLAPRIASDHDLIESIYLHTDTQELPRASTCLFVESTKIASSSNAPSREVNDVGEIFREYLLRERKNIIEIDGPYSFLNNLEAPNATVDEPLNKLIGKWFAYYPEKYSQLKFGRENHYLNSIGRGIFLLKKANYKGQFEAEFTTSEGYKLKAIVTITTNEHQYYLSIPFYSEGKEEIFLHLLIQISRISSKPVKLNGTFNIIYKNGEMGSGLVLLTRKEEHQKAKADSFSPFELKEELGAKGIYQLGFTNNSLLNYKGKDFNIDSLSEFKGLFKVYSYGRMTHDLEPDTETRCVTVSLMQISEFGYITYKGTLSGRNILYSHGRIELRGDNLYFEIRNNKMEGTQSERQGFIILHVGSYRPIGERIFCGIFSGLDFLSNRPLGKRVILEYLSEEEQNKNMFENFQPLKARIHSQEYLNLNPYIRSILSGSTHNYIGFQSGYPNFEIPHLAKFAKREYHKHLPYLTTAAYFANTYNSLIEKEKKVFDCLLKATVHGMDSLLEFEKLIDQTEVNKRLIEILKIKLKPHFPLKKQ